MNEKVSKNITALRGIGAILIVIYHCLSYVDSYWFQLKFKCFDIGWLTMCVPFFFVLSSMFLYRKALRLLNPIKLLIHRLCRLLPAYWIAVAISYFVIMTLGDKNVDVLSFWMNFLLIEDVFGFKHIDGVYWTLLYEVMLLFVLLIASVVKIGKEPLIKNPNLFCSIWLLVGMLMQIYLKIEKINLGGKDVVLLGGRYVPVFVFGILLSNRFLVHQKECYMHSLLNVVLAIVYQNICDPIYYVTMELVAVIVVYVVMCGWLVNIRILCNPILLFLGEISYCIYLCHNQLCNVVIKYLGAMDIVTQIVGMIVLFGVIFIMAAGTYVVSSNIQKRMEITLLNGLKRLQSI